MSLYQNTADIQIQYIHRWTTSILQQCRHKNSSYVTGYCITDDKTAHSVKVYTTTHTFNDIMEGVLKLVILGWCLIIPHLKLIVK